MICKNCGSDFNEKDTYCSNCGAKTNQNSIGYNYIKFDENSNQIIKYKKSKKKWFLIGIGIFVFITIFSSLFETNNSNKSYNKETTFTDNTEVVTIEKLKIYEDQYVNKLVKLKNCTLEYASFAKEYELWQWPDVIRVVSDMDLYPALNSSNIEVKGRLVKNTGNYDWLYKYVFQIEECSYR